VATPPKKQKPQLKKTNQIWASANKLLSIAVTTGTIGDLGTVVCKWALRV
jgi:hypothetical protein